MRRGLREAINDCISELQLSGHNIDADVVVEFIKSSKHPKNAKFTRIKSKILKNEVQAILLSAPTMNDEIQKLYINGALKKSDITTANPPEDDGTSTEYSQVNGGAITKTDPTLRPIKRARHNGNNEKIETSDLTLREHQKQAKAAQHELFDRHEIERSRRQFFPEVLPNFTLQALGGVEKYVNVAGKITWSTLNFP